MNLARRFGGPNGYGHIADPGGHKVTPFERLAARLKLPDATTTPTAPITVSLRTHVLSGPGIMDQGPTSSCTGHATDGAFETRLHVLGTPVPHKSPVCIYDIARCIDREPLANLTGSGDPPPLTDDGAMPNEVQRGLMEFGVCDYALRPTDPATINREPNLDELEAASGFAIKGQYELASSGTLRRSQVRQALDAGFPVCFAIDVDDAMEGWTPGGAPITACDPKHDLGGHYLYACGYTIDTHGTMTVEFVNSWGAAWGDGGFGFGDEAFIDTWQDVYVFDISVAETT